MKEYRICEVCGHKNHPGFTECEKDGADISYVNPTVEDETARAVENTLILKVDFKGDEPSGVIVDSRSRNTRILKKIKLVSKKDGFEVSIPLTGCIVGREGDVSPEYFSDFVSNRHARIFLKDGSYTIIDDKSTNGTWINDKPLAKGTECKLTAGDTVTFADMTFHVEVIE